MRDTSLTALSLAPDRRARVLAAIRRQPMADWQLAEALAAPYTAIQSPRGALVKDGLVRDSGRRVLTPFGRPSILWEAS